MLRPALLAAALLAAAAPAARAQADLHDWTLNGCASVAGDELTLETCTAGCNAELSIAEAAPLLPGSFAFDLDWSIDGPNSQTLLRVLAGSQLVLSIGGFGDPDSWCSPAPCSGATSGIEATLAYGERLTIELNAVKNGCGGFGDAGTHCTFHGFGFTPLPGIWPAQGALAAAFLGQVTGPSSAYGYGTALAVLDDLDGDGVRDFAVGAHLENPGPSAAGAIYVQSGASGALLEKLVGAAGNDHLGLSLLNPGDLDGDGLQDLVAGAPSTPGSSLPPGRLIAYSAADFSVLWQLQGDASGDRLGHHAAVIGELDGDGVPDLAVGIPGADLPGTAAGRVRAVSGATGALLWEADGFVAHESLGSSVAGVGDRNGDGTPDVLAGAPGDSVVFAGTGSARLLSGVDGSTLSVFSGDASGWRFGSMVAAVGDCNADGTPDFAAGGPGAGGGKGVVRVYSGATSQKLFDFRGNAVNEQVGGPHRLAALDDVNGDGRDDLLVGIPNADDGAGRIEIRSGLDGSALLVQPSAVEDAFLGIAVAALPDVSGDGVTDLLVGAPGDDQGLPIGTQKVLRLSGLPAHHVTPELLASGTLLAGSPVMLSIADGKPLAPAALVIGLDELSVPFKGGLLVPSPDIVLAGLPLDASGVATIPGTWPAGLSGLPVWMQAWIADAAAPAGFTATNSLGFVAP